MNKKESILLATLNLVVKNGIQNTPLSLITKEANVGMGTVYNYFKTKEDIIRELYLNIKKENAEFLLEQYDKDLPVKRRFFLLMKKVIEYYLNNPSSFLFIEQLQFSPIINDEIEKSASEYVSKVLELFKEGQKQEIIKKHDIQSQLYFVHGALSALIKLHIMGTTKLNASTIESAIISSWDAIKA